MAISRLLVERAEEPDPPEDVTAYAEEARKLERVRTELGGLRKREGELSRKLAEMPAGARARADRKRAAVAVLDGSGGAVVAEETIAAAVADELQEVREEIPVHEEALELQQSRLDEAKRKADAALREEFEPKAAEVRERLVRAAVEWGLACEEAEAFRAPLMADRIHTSGMLPPFNYRKFRLDPDSSGYCKLNEFLKDAKRLGTKVRKIRKQVEKERNR